MRLCYIFLLPLNRPRRFRRDVIDHPVDSLDLVDKAGAGARQEVLVEMVLIRRHAVYKDDSPQRTD